MHITKTLFYQSLSGRLFSALAFVALISVVGLGAADYVQARAALERQVKDQLTSIADLKKEQIITWLDERQADARLLAVNKLNQDHLTEILSPNVSPAHKAELTSFLTDNLIGLQQSRVGYSDVAFIDTQGTVVASTESEQIDRPGIHNEVFANTLASPDGTFTQDIHFDPETGLTKMAFGHVMRAVDLETGQELPNVIGVVIIAANMDDTIYPLIWAWPGMGDTGETLLIRAEGDNTVFLNNLRFDPNAALNLNIPADSPNAKPAHYASRGTEGIIQTADYRSVPVLAAYRHIPDISWGFVAKEDLDEAFAPVNTLARRIGWIAVVVLVAAAVISLALSRTLTRPLAQLVAGTRAVAAGNLSTQISIDRHDEIGALADSFRVMVDSVKQRQQQLERAITALQQSEERTKSIYNAANDAIFLIDPVEQFIIEANPKASKILGYSQEELATMPLSQIHLDEKGLLQNLLEQVLEEGTGQSDRLTCLTQRGQIIPVESSFSKVQIEDRYYVLAMVRDVTQRKQLEEQLRQAQKMEAIGQLAGGVAHDFNNLLTVITGYSELLEYQVTDESLRKDIEQIQKAGERASALTRQLLAFSRRQVLQPKVLDLNVIVADMDKMLRRLIGEDIELMINLDSSLGRVEADPGQIEQVIMNLAINARDAMPTGGKLTIETSNMSLSAMDARNYVGIEPGEYVALTVRDTGTGIDAQTQARIFEPFFTTKEANRGTGLGLATVYGIVTQSGGDIQVKSESGQGTTFSVCLPRIDETVSTVEVREFRGRLPQGSETVLLVEDEASVRRLAREVLQRNGYSVLEADSGDEALRVIDQCQCSIHLLLTDVVMPRMSGRELAEQLTSLHPEMKVVYMSGYTGNAILQRGVLEPDVNLLQKPFTPDTLARKLRAVLEN